MSHPQSSTPDKDEYQSQEEKHVAIATAAYTMALLRSLQFSGVKFVRYMTVDACNNIRAKVKPVDYLLQQAKSGSSPAGQSSLCSLNDQVSIAAVCYAGLPYYADQMVEETGMNAKNVLVVQPDLQSFRILPYAPKTAIVMGNVVDQYTDQSSPLDTRQVLENVIHRAVKEHNISFSVGVELEFNLVDAKTEAFVDESVYGNSTTLTDQEDFLAELYEQLEKQYIPIELIHAESGPGQVEVVLQYSNDPIALADNVILARETIRAVARIHNLKALFIPKYDTGKAGNGMHAHISIRDATTGRALFTAADDNFTNNHCGNDLVDTMGLTKMSSQGQSFVEGMLQHLPGLLGLSLPTTNSHRRVGPGCWTGSVVGWALEDKESGIRICSNLKTKKWDHVEYKLCDHTGNLYLTLAGIFSAGLDGLTKNLALRPSLDTENSSRGASSSPSSSVPVTPPLPGNIHEALMALELDDMLMDVMGEDLSKGYLALRRKEAERALHMTLEEEVKEFLARA